MTRFGRRFGSSFFGASTRRSLLLQHAEPIDAETVVYAQVQQEPTGGIWLESWEFLVTLLVVWMIGVWMGGSVLESYYYQYVYDVVILAMTFHCSRVAQYSERRYLDRLKS